MIVQLNDRKKTNSKKIIQVTSSKPPRTTSTSTTARSTTTTEAETTRAETTTVGEEDYEIDFDVFGTDKPEPERNVFQFNVKPKKYPKLINIRPQMTLK